MGIPALAQVTFSCCVIHLVVGMTEKGAYRTVVRVKHEDDGREFFFSCSVFVSTLEYGKQKVLDALNGKTLTGDGGDCSHK